jgi:hypothetical protein
MLQVLGLSLLALFCIAIITLMIVVNIRDSLKARRLTAKDTLRDSLISKNPPPDHTHMRSGTLADPPSVVTPRTTSVIRTNLPMRGPGLAQATPRRIVPNRDHFTSLDQAIESIDRVFSELNFGAGISNPGVQVVHRVETTVTPQTPVDPSPPSPPKKPDPPKVEKPKQVDRYHRKPVV